MPKPAIQVRDLVKKYGDLSAVNCISFDVQRGQVFSFLGPNGAGKTTTVEMIETIRTPTSGHIDILGMELKKNRSSVLKRIGVLPQDFNSFDRLTVRETVKFFSGLFNGIRDVDELIKLVNLEDERDKLYMNLSGGLKQRVGIAVALVNDPEIVFLDEPTTGLDPRARHDVWDVIKGLKQRGKTVFLTTHYMEEAEVLSDYLAIISKGSIIAEGAPLELIDKHCNTIKMTIRGGPAEIENVVRERGLTLEDAANGDVTVQIEDNAQILDLLNLLKSRNLSYHSLDIRKATLEEVFLTLTGESLTGELAEEEPSTGELAEEEPSTDEQAGGMPLTGAPLTDNQATVEEPLTPGGDVQ